MSIASCAVNYRKMVNRLGLVCGELPSSKDGKLQFGKLV